MNVHYFIPMQETVTNSKLLSMADLCVKCGICLPACPTYRLYETETDSPRGRVSLIQSLLNQQLSPSDPAVNQHLSRCLGCGNCETACPSGVSFLELLDRTKVALATDKLPQWQLNLLTNRSTVAWGLQLKKWLPDFLVDAVVKQSSRLSGAHAHSRRFPKITATSPTQTIGLFTGCIGKTIDAPALAAARFTLNLLGYEVITPNAQVCCGGLHRHEGYAETANRLVDNNIKAFQGRHLSAIVYVASGCGAELKRVENDFAIPVREISEVLLDEIDQLKPLLKDMTLVDNVLLHCPCSLRNQLKGWPAQQQLLHALFGNLITEINDNALCCGSGGVHMLKHPNAAKQLLKSKLAHLSEAGTATLLTSNTGCKMHFQAGIDENNLTTQVIHPVELIADLLIKTQ